MSEHRILRDLLAAFSDTGQGRVAVTATATGVKLNEDTLVQFVVPTWGSVDNVIILPSPQPAKVVIIAGAATGGKLRSSATATVSINEELSVDITVDAGMMVIAFCESSTSWKAFTIAADGSVGGAASGGGSASEPGGNLLLESGDKSLLESNDALLLES